MRSIARNGEIEIAYEADGRGEPVILLHGFPDTGRLWRHQKPALLEAGMRVVILDMRGYGASSKPSAVEDYNILHLLADVQAVLDTEGIESAHVVGHDWGAVVAWAFASVFPKRTRSLVAMSVGHPSTFRSSGIEQLEKSWYMLLFQFQGVAEQWLSDDNWANFRTWAGHPDADSVIQDLEAHSTLTPALNWYRANVPPESYVAPPIALPKVQAPTMGIWSTRDIALTEAQMTISASQVEGPWRYERLEGVGHWMQLEAPEAVNALLKDFLGSQLVRK
jgi:pimeloyl-ACP methyl ester carboxylesterase